MADPATQFQPATISAPYQFQGHVYTPGNVNVPSQAGEILAGIGRTALGVGQQIQNSPLFNPAARAQMQLDVANAHAGLAHIDMLNKSGLGPFTMGIDPSGHAYSVPVSQIQNPSIQGVIQRVFNPNAPVTPSTGGGGGDSGGGGGTDQGKDAAPSKPPTPVEQGQPVKTTAQVTPSSVFASTSRVAPPAYDPTAYRTGAVATPGNQFVSSEPGIPAGWQGGGGGTQPQYFLNPATGNYEPVQQQQAPPQQAEQPQQPQAQTQPGGIMDQYARDYAAGHAQGQAARQQTDLQNWQQQTIHPVVGAQDALDWFRKNRTTLAQDATYLDNGGPGGQPAYAFHMKGGGTNIVPVAQMVKAGFGPTIAANNTSVALSQTDQLQGQQQNALGAPPPMTPGAPPATTGAPPAPTAYPTVASDQGGAQGAPAPGGPPAAPGYPQIASDQGGQQGAPGPSYDPMAVRQQLAQYAQSPENLTAATGQQGQPAAAQYGPDSPPTTKAPTLTQQQQNAVTQAEQNKNINTFQGDTGFTWVRDTDPNSRYKGRMYATLPGTAGNYYDEQRFYLGSDGYHLYELPESEQRKAMDYWVDNGQLTRQQVQGMSAKEMQPWLQQRWQNENLTKTDPTGGINNALNVEEQFQMGMQRIKNLVQTLGGAQGQSERYNLAAKLRAVISNTSQSWGGREGGDIGQDILANMPPEQANAIRDLDREIGGMHQLLQAHPELIMPLGKGGGQQTPDINLESVRLGANVGASDILDNVFLGEPQADIMRKLNGLQQRGQYRYRETIQDAKTQSFRFDPRHSANLARLDTGKALPDPSDNYTSHSLFHSVPANQQPAASSAKPSPTPYPIPRNQQEYDDIPPGAQYIDPILGPTIKGAAKPK